jgi:hypothetical protein
MKCDNRMAFTATLKITIDPSKKDDFAYFVLPDKITAGYVRQQLSDAIDIDHPAVKCRIVNVKEASGP